MTAPHVWLKPLSAEQQREISKALRASPRGEVMVGVWSDETKVRLLFVGEKQEPRTRKQPITGVGTWTP
jgi:hypothetical protein